jgi:hypothetical protein
VLRTWAIITSACTLQTMIKLDCKLPAKIQTTGYLMKTTQTVSVDVI